MAGSGSGPFSFLSMKSTVMSRDFCHGAFVDASAPWPGGHAGGGVRLRSGGRARAWVWVIDQ